MKATPRIGPKEVKNDPDVINYGTKLSKILAAEQRH